MGFPVTHRTTTWRVAACIGGLTAGVLLPVVPAGAQATGAAAATALPVGYVGPAPPVAPDVVTRDGEGRVALRAVRVAQPLRIDGVLDEALYRDVPAISDFVQMEPNTGAAATEKTEAWLAFDDDNVYVAFRAWDTQLDRLVATEMRRDSTNTWLGNDIVSFIFDTFYDRRNSLTFTINPLGGRSDGQLVNERQYLPDWNPVWRLETGRFDGGWTAEAAIPFKSLRYGAGTTQVWGFNAMRVKRSKNEISTLTRVPPARGQGGFQQPGFAATLVGIEAPAGGRSLDIKPFAIANASSTRTPESSDDFTREVGLDTRYAITQNVTADLTVNTDFAQVEADEQQINLTRFGLFFPEKREFFLENQGTFSFGGVSLSSVGGAGGGAPILFYSRRIGLDDAREVPLDVGGRVTGRVGKNTFAVLNIQTGDDEGEAFAPRPTNFTVVRTKRDVFQRSSIGAMFTNRSVSSTGGGGNQALGLDANFAFLQNLQINAYWAKTRTEELRGDDDSYRLQLDYAGDRYGVQLERLDVGDDFNPQVGFVRRDDMVRDFAQFRFSPRPARRGAIRKYVYQGSLEYIENGRNVLESRERSGEFALEFQNSDRLSVNYFNSFEFLPEPSSIGSVVVPVGTYAFDTMRLGYSIAQQRRISAALQIEHGTFYSGHKTTFSATRGRMPLTSQLSVEPSYSLNRVRLAEGRFTTHLLGSRLTFTGTPTMFVSALVQYNSDTNAVSTNARLRWEYQPGSELFVVYNEERNTLARAFPSINNRALIVKVNRLFRF